jgi:hypothetical protein
MTKQHPEYPTQQTIFRVEKSKDNPFVMMDRRPLEKPYLSWKAKGLLAYLLSRPDNWIVNFGDLVKRSTDGEHATRAAAKELEEAGHLKVKRHTDKKGRVTKYEYVVLEYPLCGFPQVDIPNVDNCHINDTDSNDTDSNNIKGDANAPAPQPSKPLKANQIPQIILFREVTGKYPPKGIQFKVIVLVDKVGDRLGRTTTAEDLRPFVEEWLSRGFNPMSIKWLEDWALSGSIPANGHKPAEKPKGMTVAEQWLAKKRAEQNVNA